MQRERGDAARITRERTTQTAVADCDRRAQDSGAGRTGGWTLHTNKGKQNVSKHGVHEMRVMGDDGCSFAEHASVDCSLIARDRIAAAASLGPKLRTAADAPAIVDHASSEISTTEWRALRAAGVRGEHVARTARSVAAAAAA